jgi:beta-aspartyl-peptidase (threonine type)
MVTRPSLPGLLAAVWIAAAPWVAPRRAAAQSPQFFLVVHGGAGTIRRADMTPSQDSAYRATLALAIRTGYDVLRADGAALDAVIATITVLEDSPLFNAGRGAVLTDAGTVELDAAVMDGTALRAGAVAGVKHIKNPIQLARLVMERSPHVLLAGDGAEAFARQQGMALVPQSYFVTERRRRELERARAREPQPHGGGTVGAVALDRQGRMAAGTSTGGLTNKHWGRIGDSPIVGAGTYANATCAVSGTGTGEYFIRNVVAYDICARVRYTGVSLAQAADTVVLHELVAQGGDGGVIALDRAGHFAMPFNTEGMYRGYVGPDGKIVVKIYRDE